MEYKSQRKNVNHQMSESDIRKHKYYREEQEKRDEVARLSRVQIETEKLEHIMK